MRCPHCGLDGSGSARFCAGCGHRLPEPAAGRTHGPPALVATCHRCGETLSPDSYFSRGLNVAKLVALLPINFILPILFFFLRKDRLVCGNCRKLLPATAILPLLPAMPEGPGSALVLSGDVTALALSSPEGQQLAKASRGAKASGVLFAMFAMPLSLPVFAFLGSLGWAEMAVVGLPGGLLLAGSVNAFRRASMLARRARESESKHMRRQIVALAQRHQGRINVAQVAATLGCDFKDAEALLDAMIDGRHVDVEVTDDGRLVYVFPDLVA